MKVPERELALSSVGYPLTVENACKSVRELSFLFSGLGWGWGYGCLSHIMGSSDSDACLVWVLGSELILALNPCHIMYLQHQCRLLRYLALQCSNC